MSSYRKQRERHESRGRNFVNVRKTMRLLGLTNNFISMYSLGLNVSPHLQSESEKGGSDGGAVDGPVAPGGGQAHRMIAVHVGKKKQPCSRTLADVPEVYGQRGPRDDLSIG